MRKCFLTPTNIRPETGELIGIMYKSPNHVALERS